MNLMELLPEIQQLSLLDKIRLIAILAKEIEQPIASELSVDESQQLIRLEQATLILDSLKGKGSGVWDVDAQQYIDQLREDDRF